PPRSTLFPYTTLFRSRRRVVALLIAAGDAVDRERLRRRVAAAPGAVEADGGAGAGAQVAVPRHALGGHPGAGLAPGGAPALLQALAGGREVEGERPLVQRVTEVLDGDRGGEPAARPVAPVVGGVLDVAGDRGLCRRGLPGDQTEGRDACRGRGHGPSPQAAWDLHESSTPGGTEAYLGALPIV